MEINRLLQLMLEKGASDLHLTVPSHPAFRIDGILVPQEEFPPMTPGGILEIFEQITTAQQKEVFTKEFELDFAYSITGVARFRVNALRQRGSLSLAFRLVPFNVPTIDEMELPQVFKKLVLKEKGLVLITGATGSGKSTTLAAMINHINSNAKRNVITVEDPIEFLFQNKKSIIRQRDIGDDTRSFANALHYVLRHDPDVIVIGEMRDLPTVSEALRAAETGHLVLGTMHAIDAVQAVDRIIDIFPAVQHRQIRLQLSQVMVAVIYQMLLSRIGGGRVAACEIMLTNSVIRRLILEEKVYEISPNMEMSRLDGMQTLEQAMADLVKKGIVSKEEALERTYSPVKLKQMLEV
jgi:twitching motility protein PilT